LLGMYNSQETMDKHICAAAGNGVDFFKILWYNVYDRVCENYYNNPLLNTGLDHFINSPESWRMKFMLEFCNTGCFSAQTDAEWMGVVARWEPYLRHPSYLRVNGKLVLQIHDGGTFWVNSGQNLAKAQWRLNYLRNMCENVWGIGQMLIGVGSPAPSASGSWEVQAGFDWKTIYGHPDVAPYSPTLYPYSVLADAVRVERASHSNDVIPYLPMVMEGWDARPWKSYDNTRPNFQKASNAEFEAELLAAKQIAEASSVFGFPGQPAISIYNWSEYGEGGYIAPTKGWGFARLDSIRKIFGAPDQFAGYYVIKNIGSKKSLRVENGSTASGAAIVQQTYENNIADAPSWWWNVVKLVNGQYRIINVKSGLAMTASGSAAVQAPYQTADVFSWTITEQAGGVFTLAGAASQECLTPVNQSSSEGAPIMLQTCPQTHGFQWVLVRPENYGLWECPAPLLADFNDDCVVNLTDFAFMAGQWMDCNRVPVSSCP